MFNLIFAIKTINFIFAGLIDSIRSKFSKLNSSQAQKIVSDSLNDISKNVIEIQKKSSQLSKIEEITRGIFSYEAFLINKLREKNYNLRYWNNYYYEMWGEEINRPLYNYLKIEKRLKREHEE